MTLHTLKRFFTYVQVGGSTFLLDLLLLYIFTDIFLVNYLVATAVAFVIAVSINYIISRRYVFKGTLRQLHTGYVVFGGIALSGLMLVVVLMAIIVEKFHVDFIVARVIVACVVGMWNYLMNLYVNFKVVGQHHL